MSSQRLIPVALACVGAVLLAGTAFAADVTLRSARTQTGLLELYTSEGCSSCPPADHFVSGFTEDDSLWRELIPVAFHVDYWNYLGWEDRFASSEYSARQSRYVRQGDVSTVYTPGFIYNGSEWKAWFARRYFDFPQGATPGILEASITAQTVNVVFDPDATAAATTHVSVALLGFGLATEVGAGENRGRDLQHDFVVLDLVRQPLQQAGARYVAEMALPETEVPASRYGIAVWVTGDDGLRPVQAVGGWLSN